MVKNINEQNLKIDEPQLASEWNYAKNSYLPENYRKSSCEKVWWICKNGHTWEAQIRARAMGLKTGCPYCANKKACSDNCLETKFPKVAKEWNYDKNTLTPKDVLPHTNKKVWWKCENGHEWMALISDRANGTQCTECFYGYVVRERGDIYNEDKTKKLCKECNEWCYVLNFRTRFRIDKNGKRSVYRNNICKKCDARLVQNYRKTKQGIAAEIVRRTKWISKNKNIPFDLDKIWVLNRLNEIDWKCELTGLPMKSTQDYLEEKKIGFQWDSLSIDKIDPKKGYIKSNVRFVLNQINIFKQDGDDNRIYMLAEALLKFRKKNNE